MNKTQRKALQEYVDKAVPFIGELEEMVAKLDDLSGEEGSKNHLGDAAKEKAEEDVADIDTAKDELRLARDCLDNAVNALMSAMER